MLSKSEYDADDDDDDNDDDYEPSEVESFGEQEYDSSASVSPASTASIVLRWSFETSINRSLNIGL